MTTISPCDITGLILAGGQGQRMGGRDKGLQTLHGEPLVQHALRRLRPQVGGGLMISANRHLDAYRAFGWPVWPDEPDALAPEAASRSEPPSEGPRYPGPLAGLLTGLIHCPTPYLAVVPCDSPLLPADLVERLTQALASSPDPAQATWPGARHPLLALAHTPDAGQRPAPSWLKSLPPGHTPQPVFCLLHRSLAPSLRASLAAGQRSVLRWASQQPHAWAAFADAQAFANANTLADLSQLALNPTPAHTAQPARPT